MRLLFGAGAQVVVGVAATVVALAAWLYWGIISYPTVNAVFHISMFFGVVACYAIIATGLGYKATERVETIIEESPSIKTDGIDEST